MKRTSREDRQQNLAAWRASGKSIRQFCRENGLNHYTFYGWLEAQRKEGGKQAGFVEVALEPVVAPTRTSVPVVLYYGKSRIELSSGFDGETLRAVLLVLERLSVS